MAMLSGVDLDEAQIGNAPEADELWRGETAGGKRHHQLRAAGDRRPLAGLAASRSSTAARLPGATSSCICCITAHVRLLADWVPCVAVLAAETTDSKMRMNPVQRQRLPASASRISAIVGCGLCASSCVGGHQHARRADAALRAADCRNAFCKGCSSPSMRESFDGLNLCAFGLQHWNQATVHQARRSCARSRSRTRLRRILPWCRSGADLRAARRAGASSAEHCNGAALAVHGEFELSANRVRSYGSPAPRPSGVRRVSRTDPQASSGIALKLTPVASRIALRIAGAGPSCGSSPMPFAPNPP